MKRFERRSRPALTVARRDPLRDAPDAGSLIAAWERFAEAVTAAEREGTDPAHDPWVRRRYEHWAYEVHAR